MALGWPVLKEGQCPGAGPPLAPCAGPPATRMWPTGELRSGGWGYPQSGERDGRREAGTLHQALAWQLPWAAEMASLAGPPQSPGEPSAAHPLVNCHYRHLNALAGPGAARAQPPLHRRPGSCCRASPRHPHPTKPLDIHVRPPQLLPWPPGPSLASRSSQRVPASRAGLPPPTPTCCAHLPGSRAALCLEHLPRQPASLSPWSAAQARPAPPAAAPAPAPCPASPDRQ